MQDIQDRILARIAAAAEAVNLDTTRKEHWSNTGTVFFHEKGAIVPIGEATYNFQADTYTLTLTWEGRKVPSQEGRADYFSFYQKYSEHSRFWDAFEGEATPFVPPELSVQSSPDRAHELARQLALRMREIDPTKGRDDDQPPNGDHYNDLWDAILDEVKAAAPDFDMAAALKGDAK